LGSLKVFEDEKVIDSLGPKINSLKEALASVENPHWGDVRQVGMIVGIDLLDHQTGDALNWRKETGARVCRAARKYGLLTRPVGDTLTLMPPLCSSVDQIKSAVTALDHATRDLLS
jgi:adenosylmethionine-8-amino-7-oxononanoate aminotransferase